VVGGTLECCGKKETLCLCDLEERGQTLKETARSGLVNRSFNIFTPPVFAPRYALSHIYGLKMLLNCTWTCSMVSAVLSILLWVSFHPILVVHFIEIVVLYGEFCNMIGSSIF
jgi:hypothetical protein